VRFSRLSIENIPQIGRLLMSVWPAKYGRMGFPNFREDYLHWVFGGPNSDKHILLGGKIDDELVAYLSFLYRRIYNCGRTINGYLYTHATISPHLSSQVRFDALLKMLNLMEDIYFSSNCDLIYGFSEERKEFRDNFMKLGETYTKMDFMKARQLVLNQCLVDPGKLRQYIQEHSRTEGNCQLRPVSENDYAEMGALFDRIGAEKGLSMQMTEEELRHHFHGHPDHRTFVIESRGVIKAFNNYYPLEIIKEDKSCKYVVVELLISEDTNGNNITALLQEAINFAEEIGARGVVIENATYLDYDACKTLGLMATFRKMTMTVLPKSFSIDDLDGFMCDVK
jgi:hypothetical protein